MTARQLQIGRSDYRSFIKNNGYFLDKTLFIKEVIDNAHQVMLLPRPRRFGKTFNLSMLRYFFDASLKDTAALFEPYLIWQAGDYYTEQQGQYPVIHLSLKGGKATNFERSQKGIFHILSQVYQENRWLLDENILADNEVIEFNEILLKKAGSVIYENALRNLSGYLYRFYKKEVIILMDEYDAPVHTGFHHDYYDKIIELMKSLMGNTFKDNPYLRKGVITGILRIAKESIFSDLNNPGIFTLLNYDFADKFGFTEQEVQQLLNDFDLSDHFVAVKEWYDGYNIGNVQHIYNPWSVINYVDKHREGFKSYWANTSSDELIKSRVIEKEAYDVRTSLEKLIKGETIVRYINENIIFSDFEEDKEILWSLLMFSGYLSPIQETDWKEYEIKIPNYEIKTLFKEIIVEWFRKGIKVRQTTLRNMTKSLINHRIEDFKKYFKEVMSDTFSYFDIHTEPERVYQAYVLGLLGMLSDDYIIKSNRESGKGRYDIMLLPKQNSKYGIVIEIKQLETDASSIRIQATLSAALKQIVKNKYYQELLAHGVHRRVEMAMVFVGKEVYVDVN